MGKRHSLKKLLHPGSPDNAKSKESSSASLPSLQSTASLRSDSTSLDPTVSPGSMSSVPGVPGGVLSEEELQEDLVLEQMAERSKVIGDGHARERDGVDSAALSPQSSASATPATSPPAPAKTGGMYASSMYAAFAPGFSGERKGGKKSSKQRFAERQAKKTEALLSSAPPSDPAWTAQLEKERHEEIQVITSACAVLGREIYEIAPDGHCMYSAIADQLGQLGMLGPAQAGNPYAVRRTAAHYLREHKDDFLPFLASVDGEDMPGATDDGIMTDKQFEEYVHRVESTGEWGGEPEALSRAFKIPIHVVQRGPPTIVSHGSEDDAFGGALTPEQSAAVGPKCLRLSYHKRMYGLGEHYNSLRLVQ